MTDKKLTREEIGVTDISLGNQRILLIFFFVFIFSVPLFQFIYKLSNDNTDAGSFFVSIDQKADSLSYLDKLKIMNYKLLLAKDNYETSIEEQSIYRKKMIPIVQYSLVSIFNVGNENAWIGRNNMYYKISNQYLTLSGFLDKRQLRKRKDEESVQPNPLTAILNFSEQLSERNIQLIVLPAPPKASFVVQNKKAEPLNNKSYELFVETLREKGVIVCDAFKILTNNTFKNSGFLKYDTHWSPETIELLAKNLCENLYDLQIKKGIKDYKIEKVEVINHGDIADMLKLNNLDVFFDADTVEIKKVTENNYLFIPSKESDILFLGDSYSNIYSLNKINWGESAGLTEQISAIMKKPVDRILMNNDGAYATRLELANEMKRGRDRLSGKKVVIWQFAVRELSVGDWKLLNLELNENYTSNFFTPEFGEYRTVTGIVREASPVPMHGTGPYKDHVFTVYISDLKDIESNTYLGQSIVYLSSMENNVWTEAARLRSGDKIKLKLYNWDAYSEKFGSINRSEIIDDDLSLEEPCWGELIQK